MNVRILFPAIAFVWMLQLVLSLLQTRRFYRKVAALRKLGGITSVGVSGSNWTLKNYGVLVVDDTRTITHAQRLSGITVFAGPRDVPELVGKRLSVLHERTALPGVGTKLWAAFQNAAEFLTRHDQRVAEDAAESQTQRDPTDPEPE